MPRLIISGLVALACGLGAGSAGADSVPAAKLGVIVLRVLAYDHTLASRAGAAVVVAVVEGADDDAKTCAADMTAAITKLAAELTVSKLPVKVARVAMADGKGLTTALTRLHAVAAYACVPAAQAAVLARATRAAQALSFTVDHDAVASLAIGLVRAADKIEIQVNLVAARAEGAQLSAPLLRIAKVVQR